MKLPAVVVLVCLALPATATAARVELRPGPVPGEHELVYTAGADEVNDVRLHRQAGTPVGSVWSVLDNEAPPTERVPPCAEGTYFIVGPGSHCPDDHVASIVVDLGDRDDVAPVDSGFTIIYIPVRILGGPGRDRIHMHSDGGNTLDGGPGDDLIVSEDWAGYHPRQSGADTILGGEGDDEIRTKDYDRDVVSCGPGMDTVAGDWLDVVDEDCETVTGAYQPSPPPDVWQRADGRPVGVTINRAARYTNDRRVTLTILPPPGATRLLISDDGGFETWYSTPPTETERYRFRLASSGSERLPKTVYVRFDLDLNRTFTDDIILDQRRPRVLRARLHGAHRVTLRARDAMSGVRSAQFARVRKRPWAAVRFGQRLMVRRAPKWVRVRDRAGNVSRWQRVSG
ncbi:MAG TPA: calcium-binding protein [Solirubrobacterales bacterium]|nr:calcium-binding protein [Solirubrobacterales bacterium]